ncbi:MAG: hypothetical protein GY883_15580 [Shimia sp.]|nr:hypothetical protein [Shimia sp.]
MTQDLSYALPIYLALGTGLVALMSVMILHIGAMVGDCPQSSRAAKAAARTIAAGYAVIGLGTVVLLATLLPALDLGLLGILPLTGLVAIGLGLGFTSAVDTLRAMVQTAAMPSTAVPMPQPDQPTSAA